MIIGKQIGRPAGTVDVVVGAGRIAAVVIAGVHHDGQAQLVLIAGALDAFGGFLGPGQRRQEHGGQDRDDGDDHQKLNERKGGRFRARPADCNSSHSSKFYLNAGLDAKAIFLAQYIFTFLGALLILLLILILISSPSCQD